MGSLPERVVSVVVGDDLDDNVACSSSVVLDEICLPLLNVTASSGVSDEASVKITFNDWLTIGDENFGHCVIGGTINRQQCESSFVLHLVGITVILLIAKLQVKNHKHSCLYHCTIYIKPVCYFALRTVVDVLKHIVIMLLPSGQKTAVLESNFPH
ncbi:hypothetical protein Tcan_00264 [Toxocara canis]|uniref:Uncharacterized protein n=1 Tax=Toxocara canis TaxID=6265 RepID=A0A0B2UVF1_TOXCA|nr:hypothetical protein Tcan_00264 [Toxocara canis]